MEDEERLKLEADKLYKRYSELVNSGRMEDMIEVVVFYRTPPISSGEDVSIALDSLLSFSNMVRCTENAGISTTYRNAEGMQPLAFPAPIKFVKKYNVFASSLGMPLIKDHKCIRMLDKFVSVDDDWKKIEEVSIQKEPVHIRKFPDASILANMRGPRGDISHIDTTRNEFKSIDEVYTQQIVEGHVFFAYGNLDEITLLCDMIKERGIGKKVNLGYGSIYKIIVSKVGFSNIDEISVSVDGRRFLHKHIPCKLLDVPLKQPIYGYAGFKPSYWSHQTDVYMWGSEMNADGE